MNLRLVVASVALACSGGAAASEIADSTYHTVVDPAGAITLPADFRSGWTHLGSWVVPDAKAPGHGFHDVYTQSSAAAAYRATGAFPDGTVLVKEIRAIVSAPLSTGPQVQWAGDPVVWFVMVKDDQRRFAGNPNWGEGWGWALFEAKAPGVNASKGFATSCQGCHVPAMSTDWVYVRGYPTLRAASAIAPAAPAMQ